MRLWRLYTKINRGFIAIFIEPCEWVSCIGQSIIDSAQFIRSIVDGISFIMGAPKFGLVFHFNSCYFCFWRPRFCSLPAYHFISISAFAEQECKSEYLDLRRQCQQFAVDLLDQSRSSQEMAIILNHDPEAPPYADGDHMKLARLELAINYKQKKVNVWSSQRVQQRYSFAISLSMVFSLWRIQIFSNCWPVYGIKVCQAFDVKLQLKKCSSLSVWSFSSHCTAWCICCFPAAAVRNSCENHLWNSWFTHRLTCFSCVSFFCLLFFSVSYKINLKPTAPLHTLMLN